MDQSETAAVAKRPTTTVPNAMKMKLLSVALLELAIAFLPFAPTTPLSADTL
jgi:hypothetical protein